jgi:hypothetical protein
MRDIVVPAKAGTQVLIFKNENLDPRFRGDDGFGPSF